VRFSPYRRSCTLTACRLKRSGKVARGCRCPAR
jgi:hypothetical protein